MLIKLNNQFEHNGVPNYHIESIISAKKTKSQDAEMADCTAKGRKSSDAVSDLTISTNHHSTTEENSGDSGSANRILEVQSSYTNTMIERWNRANNLAIPQLDQ